jgi:diguanylate cyclase (GGDEF)-like protein/PAS domain S-box-containing protein
MRMSVGIKLGLCLAMLGTVSTGLIGYYVYDRNQLLLLESSKDKLLTTTQVVAQRLDDTLSEIATDVTFIRALAEPRAILEQKAPSQLPNLHNQMLEQIFKGLLTARPEYSQIRLIDALHYGKERVRVDRDQNDIKVISGAQLQEKNHFPYMFETARLRAGELYLSEINLNQELGNHLAYGDPMVRIATPVKDTTNKTLGIIVINVNLNVLFERIRANLPQDLKILLTNSRGDYLIHPDRAKTFAFERGQQYLIQSDIPTMQKLINGEQDYLLTSGNLGLPGNNSLAAFVRQSLPSFAEQRMIILGLYTSLDKVLADSKALGVNVIKVILLFVILAVTVSLVMARFLTQPLDQIAKSLSQFELGKPMTHLPIQRNDELGYLARSFARMTNKLHQQIDELHTSETKLQTILDNLPLGIWLIGFNQQTRYLNKTFRDNLGIPDQQFFSDTKLNKLLKNDSPSEQTSLTIYEWLTFIDGYEHLLEIQKLKLYDQSGNAEAMIGIATDITKRRKDEEMLRSSEEKLRTLFEMSPLGIARNSQNGRYIEANKAFLDMIGYTLDELNGLSSWQLTPSEYEAQEQLQFHSLTSKGSYGPYEKEYLHRDGRRISVRLNGVMITDSDGEQYVWSIVEDITQKKQSEHLIWQQANFDPLTGLPNRRMFHERLNMDIKKAKHNDLPLALIFLDLDRFKEVNDTLGHDIGDLLLQDAARRLTSCVRESDTVARLGGDEFTLILRGLDDPSSVERIVNNILQKMAEPFHLKNKLAYVSASIGITIYPKDGNDIDTLIKNADQSMYASKDLGRNRRSYFTHSMQAAALAKMQTANDLRCALSANQFQLYYQPIVEISTGHIKKAEALIRWLHPSKGMINPAEFIPIAEDIGIINEIGDWVFFEATRQLAQWHRHYPAFQVSINKSPAQFFNAGGNHESWLEHLRQLNLPGDSVAVEITEGLLLEANHEVVKTLQLFRNAGLQISLDDFGTGYSSLAYLKKFDIDYIKIDRSFVGHLSPNANDLALCEAIIVMAHKLGMKVIAEGIETQQQQDLLISAGCDYGQGFLFSKPVPANEFEQLLIRHASTDRG